MTPKKWKFAGCVLFIAGSTLVGLAIVLLTGIPLEKIIRQQVLDRSILGHTDDGNLTDMTKQWLHPPYKMRLNIWMYNIANVDEILRHNEKPLLQEIGPFVFVERQVKELVRFEANDSQVIYRNRRYYQFSQKESCSSCVLEKRIVIPNIVFQKLVDYANMTAFGFRLKFAIESILRVAKEGPFVTVSVGEALFDGYNDPLVDLVCKNAVLKFLCETGSIQPKIGFFFGMNGTTTADGTFEVRTGPMDIGQVVNWNNLTAMPDDVWDTPQARAINGTDGQLFAPLMQQRKTRLTIFAPQICRSIQLAYSTDVSVGGVPAWRFTPPADLYDPTIPENHGFCNRHGTPKYFENATVQPETCLPAGMIDVSRCQAGNPRIYLSQPHFYSSPVEVWNKVRGVAAPSKDNDETFVEIEPTTGVPIRAHRLVQINVGMVKGDLSVTQNTTNVILPVLWMNETAEFDAATRDQLRAVVRIRKLAYWAGVSLLTIGLLLCVTFFAVLIVADRTVANAEEYSRLTIDEDDGGLQAEEEAQAPPAQDSRVEELLGM